MLALPFAQREPASLGSPSPRFEAKGKARPYPPSVHASSATGKASHEASPLARAAAFSFLRAPQKIPAPSRAFSSLHNARRELPFPDAPNQALEVFLF